jgi:hypothetical protein
VSFSESFYRRYELYQSLNHFFQLYRSLFGLLNHFTEFVWSVLNHFTEFVKLLGSMAAMEVIVIKLSCSFLLN